MKKLLIVVVLLALGAGAYFFLTPSGDPKQSPEAESAKQGAEVVKKSDESSEDNSAASPSPSSSQVDSMDGEPDSQETVSLAEVESVDASDLTEAAEEIVEVVDEATEEVVEASTELENTLEESATDAQEAVESAESTVIVDETSEVSTELAVAEEAVSEATTEEIMVTDAAANVASTEVIEEIVETELAEQDDEVQAVNEEIDTALATAEAMAADIEANSAAVAESTSSEVDAKAELARKLQTLVDQGDLSDDQFEMLWTAIAASSEGSSNVAETETPEWLLNPPAVDWDAVAARIDALHATGAITDSQYQKFKANIAKESETVDMAVNESTAATVSKIDNMVTEASSGIANSGNNEASNSASQSGSAYDVRINGYPLPSHLSSDYKFDLVKLFLQKNASGTDSYRIAINNHQVPPNVDPYVLELLFDLLLSRENSN